MIVGIDPGFKGAISILAKDGLSVHDMPVITSPKGKTEIDHHGLLRVLMTASGTVWLERVATMPGQGISSAFRFGQGYGSIEMACAACNLPIRYVTPAVWKKHFGLSKDKGASRALAMQRFPESADLFSRVKDEGRAEAALVALYGKEKSQ